jgi:hypothetical protein
MSLDLAMAHQQTLLPANGFRVIVLTGWEQGQRMKELRPIYRAQRASSTIISVLVLQVKGLSLT